jgi:hypothetical protein
MRRKQAILFLGALTVHLGCVGRMPWDMLLSAAAVADEAEAPVSVVESKNEDAEAHAPFVFSGNGYDFVLFVCRARKIEVAVDPEVLADLCKLKIDVSQPSTASGWQLLKDHLQAVGYPMYQAPVTATRKVAMVTSATAWAHYSAMDALRRGDVKGAYGVLKTVQDETTQLGKRCVELRKAMDELMARNAQLARIEADVQRALTQYRRAVSDVETAKLAHGSKINTGESMAGTLVGFAEARQAQAEAEAKQAWARMDQLMEKMRDSNEQIGTVFSYAYTRGYTGEAWFLFDNLYSSFSRFRALLGAMQRDGLAASDEDLGKMPEQVTALREELRVRVEEAAAQLKSAGARHEGGDMDAAGAAFERAYGMDGSSTQARLMSGLMATRRGVNALDRLFEPVSNEEREKRLTAMEQFCRESEKLGQLRALVEIRTGKAMEGMVMPSTREGSATGLAVRDGKGRLFPLSARIESVPTREATTSDAPDAYWSSLLAKSIRERDWPVTFGDYGDKDAFMTMAAIEAYKWLRSIDGTLKGRTGLRIEFQELLAGKGGDSAGVTIATAGYSMLRQAPVRMDVAMTGSVRGDGGVKAVGAVPEKISGALIEPRVELVIVPRENEADLLTLSAETLCRVVVVVTDDMRTCLKYATAVDNGSMSQEQRDAMAMVAKLQLAQAKLQLGRVVEAQEILVSLAGAPRELYTAHRLLELLQARYGGEGRMMEATLLRRQSDEVRTRSMVTVLKRDFVVARDGNIVAGFHDLPLLPTRSKPAPVDQAAKEPADRKENRPANRPADQKGPPTSPANPVTEHESKEKPKNAARVRIVGKFGGKGVFNLRGSKVWFRHVAGPKLGTFNNQPQPIQINGIPWHVTWNGNETRPYLALTPPFLPPSGSEIVVTCSAARGKVTVVEYPSSNNNYTLVFALDFGRTSKELSDATIEIGW